MPIDIQSKSQRTVINCIFLAALAADFYFSEYATTIFSKLIYAGVFWIIIAGYFLLRYHVKKNLRDEIIDVEMEEFEEAEEEKARVKYENLIFLIVLVIGIYFTAMILTITR